MFDGDWHLALASYNGGPARLQRAIKQAGGVDDFWKLSAEAKLLPRETREYVPMILAAIVIARNPAQYGFDFEPETASSYEKVTLSKPVDLRRVAEWAETTIDEIQALNPELRRWTTPVGDAQYELKVPAGTGDQVSTRLADAAAVELASLNWYTVKRGDTLALIAKKLKVSRTDLAEANYLSTTARVSTGQKLMVPREATVLMASRSTPAEESAQVVKPEKAPAVAAARRTVPETGALASTPGSNRVKVIYSVKQGDTLASIARLFKTTVAALQNWNPDPRGSHRGRSASDGLPTTLGGPLPFFTRSSLRSQLLDALLDALGQLTFVLQRAQRVARLLQREFELRHLLGDVIDDRLLLAQRFEVDPDVVEQVGDGVGLRLHLVDELSARVDRDNPLVGFGDA